jgi:hypothetical protein
VPVINCSDRAVAVALHAAHRRSTEKSRDQSCKRSPCIMWSQEWADACRPARSRHRPVQAQALAAEHATSTGCYGKFTIAPSDNFERERRQEDTVAAARFPARPVAVWLSGQGPPRAGKWG